jgi:hypothetical protein
MLKGTPQLRKHPVFYSFDKRHCSTRATTDPFLEHTISYTKVLAGRIVAVLL